MTENIKVLIVDDNIINRQYFSMSLKKFGYLVVTAESGSDAIEIAKQQNFDIILMDIRMPDMDGYETTKYIKKLPNHETTTIIASSAEEIALEHEQLFSGFLLKPVRPIQLKNIIHEHSNISLNNKKIFNHDDAIKYAYNDVSIMNRLIAMFVTDLPKQIHLLKSSLNNHKFEESGDIIHKIRGSCKACGAQELDKQLSILSSIIKNEIKTEIIVSFEETEKCVVNYLNYTKKYLHAT